MRDNKTLEKQILIYENMFNRIRMCRLREILNTEED